MFITIVAESAYKLFIYVEGGMERLAIQHIYLLCKYSFDFFFTGEKDEVKLLVPVHYVVAYICCNRKGLLLFFWKSWRAVAIGVSI